MKLEKENKSYSHSDMSNVFNSLRNKKENSFNGKKENKENIDLIRLQSKIQSIALLHRELYASKDKKTVDLQLYFKICFRTRHDTLHCTAFFFT